MKRNPIDQSMKDPDNKATSAYSRTFSVVVSVDDTKNAFDKFDKMI